MKITCLQENLNNGLFIVNHLATGNTTLPILNNILLKTEKGNLTLTSTNLEIGIHTQVRGKVEKEGSFTIPSQILNNYINLLPKDQVILELVENELIVKCKNSKTKIKGISVEDFPLIPKIEKRNGFKIKAIDFKKALQQVIFSVYQDESRPEISGVLFNFNYPQIGKLTLTGTDSYRLSEKNIDLKEFNIKENIKIIVPRNTIQELLRILTQENEIIEIYFTENQILFIYKETEIISRLISGQYPDYQQIIPENHKTKVLINKNNFIKVIKGASIFSQSGINDINLEILPKDNKIIIHSLNNQLGEYKAEIEGEIEGIENKIVFNYKYLLDGLLGIEEDEISLEIINDTLPGILRLVNNKSYLYLIMPIKQ
ncbi:MAG: DNA polymerase III subunit beta [Parcubacteria group bacterium Athens1014_10]|nr:MAG: DNA polymerase III subunit beta [Parcubacteria group bacterium Athens1014_10]TSD05111.1 MAG: DNA polymerase III subunit beta [Parcubacteria group bacterium Athens0714_12]